MASARKGAAPAVQWPGTVEDDIIERDVDYSFLLNPSCLLDSG